MSNLADFVAQHRGRFSTEQENIFAFSWGKALRRYQFLAIIQQRHAIASAAFIANSEAIQKATSTGSGPISAELATIMNAGQGLSADLHLQIESYYLFAKIVLDDVARAIEYYFGPQNRLALDSHDDLAKRLEGYATAKELRVSEEFSAAVADLKKRVCDVRDQQIAHEKSPRTIQGTTWGADQAEPASWARGYTREARTRRNGKPRLPINYARRSTPT